MCEPAGVDPRFCGCDRSTDDTPIPPVVLARLAAMASERAFLPFIPRQLDHAIRA